MMIYQLVEEKKYYCCRRKGNIAIVKENNLTIPRIS